MVGRLRQFVWLVWILAIFSCSDERNVSDDPTLFRLLTSDESGISFNNTLHSNGDLNIIEYLYFYNGGGVAVGDINNDGLKDVFFTGNQVENKLYLNMGNLKFQDITKEAGFVINPDWTTGVSMADINNDGYLDIYISVVSQYKNLEGHNLLYLNNGDLTFSEASEKWGLDFKGFGTHSGFFDYDRDGDLDVYLLNHAVHTTRSYTSAAGRNNFDALAGDRLLENQLSEGSNFFIDISESAGIFSSPQGYGLGLVISDINQDGWPDIYVGNDFHEDDYLYINQMDGTFKESLAGYFNHTSRFTMGVDIADVNGDLTSDVFSLDMLPADNQILMKSGGEESDKVAEIKMGFGYKNQYARNAFQLNNRNQYFSDISLLTNTYASDWSWSVLLQDYDNDGKMDIFITNGIYKRPNDLDYINFLSNINLSNINLSREEQDSLERVLIETMPSLKIPNYMYRNLGELNFKEISEEWGLDIPSYSSGAVYSDLDNDGDLDLVVNNVNSDAFLFENLTDSLRLSHYLKVNLAGKLNKFGVGADVYLYARDKTWRREEFGTRGFQSSSASILHFGLGEVSQVDSLVIYWPDGTMQTHGPVDVDKTLNIVQNSKPYSKQLDKENQTVQYLDFRHIENQFNDYDNEPLILEKLSTEGPALGTADFNSDGLKDFYVGGARGQSGAIYYQLRDGGFSKFVSESFQKDELFEDIDVGILDVENDGDMDIYVVSGGGD
ncbi:MAG: VCBS repeat-containing protein, partial [Cyclobacteriaceae bacterium]|nr:VCBS repeat-containing protein [Cyclobacteriaceae bacterium]